MSQHDDLTEDPSVPTPGYAVEPTTEHNPNKPQPGETLLSWDDAPPVDGGAAAVHPRTGEMLRPDGSAAMPKDGV